MNIVFRSTITTFFSTLLTLLPVSFFVIKDVPWVKVIAVAVCIAFLRTLVAYFDPKNPEIGKVSENPSHDELSNIKK